MSDASTNGAPVGGDRRSSLRSQVGSSSLEVSESPCQVFAEPSTDAPLCVASGYYFTPLSDAQQKSYATAWKQAAFDKGLKGTLIFSPEGVNIQLMGPREAVDAYWAFLQAQPVLRGLEHPLITDAGLKPPFKRMSVKYKATLLPGNYALYQDLFKKPGDEAPYITPEQLKAWYEADMPMLVLDVRNDYECKLGTFQDAEHLHIRQFVDFQKAWDAYQSRSEAWKDRPVVTCCTGGIRCEKAAVYLKQCGVPEVYQLHQGILGYLERVGGTGYHGECFVFDRRIAVGASLLPTDTRQCVDCRMANTHEDQVKSGGSCIYCEGRLWFD